MSLNFNWIDIIAIAIICYSVSRGMKSNILVEVIKLFGQFFAIFFTLHYYTRLGNLIHEYLFIPIIIKNFIAYTLLWITIVVIFKILADGWKLILRIETHPVVDKWGGIVISSVRSFLVISLFLNMIFTTRNVYLAKISRRSFSGAYFVDLAPQMYGLIYENLVKRHFPHEYLNSNVFQLKGVGR